MIIGYIPANYMNVKIFFTINTSLVRKLNEYKKLILLNMSKYIKLYHDLFEKYIFEEK